MNELNVGTAELSQALGYANTTTINKVQRGEVFVDVERLHLFAKLRTPQGDPIDLNWLIAGSDGVGGTQMNLQSADARAKIQRIGTITATAEELLPSHSAKQLVRVTKWSAGIGGTGNILVHGDNLDALTALARSQPESVRCAYLDPPYNNGESYQHYFDSMGHEEWLHAVTERLKQVKALLRKDGSCWVSIDDSELHYLKVASDQVFGRANFVGTIIWERRTTRENRKVFSRKHEYLLVYAKNIDAWTKSRNALPLTDDVKDRYKNPDADPRGAWQSVSANVQDGHATESQYYAIESPSGRTNWPPKGRCWVYSKAKMKQEIEKNNIWFGNDGNGVPRIKQFLSNRKEGLTPETLWHATEVGTTSDAKKHLLELFKETNLFDTPKPEQLISRIIHISSDPGDIVLDPYLGSGTTTAVAHKMGRRYIGIENGEHIKTHCVHRLRQVIAGEAGGVSPDFEWKGGGGFDFYTVKDAKKRGG